MSHYTAKVVSKQLNNGMLTVDVEFTDGQETVSERFETNQPQPDEWLAEQIQRKINHLDGVRSLASVITEGETFTAAPQPVVKSQVKTDREQYAEDLQRFEKFISAMSKGFITQDHEDFRELKRKLTETFKTEYLDLFA